MIVLDLAYFIRFIRSFLVPMRRYKRYVTISYDSHSHPRTSVMGRHRAELLDCLEAVRGEGIVTVTVPTDADSRLVGLQESMKHIYTNVDEVLERALHYRDLVQEYYDSGKLHATRSIASEAMHWLDTIKVPQDIQHLGDRSKMFPDDKLLQLQEVRVDFAFRLCETSYRLGNASIMLATIYHLAADHPAIFYKQASHTCHLAKLTKPGYAIAYYWAGLAFMTNGRFNLAAWCLFESLQRAPNRVQTKWAIDHLESCISSMEPVPQAIVEVNFKLTIRPFRQCTPSESQDLNEKQRLILKNGFRGLPEERKFMGGNLKVCYRYLKVTLC